MYACNGYYDKAYFIKNWITPVHPVHVAGTYSYIKIVIFQKTYLRVENKNVKNIFWENYMQLKFIFFN